MNEIPSRPTNTVIDLTLLQNPSEKPDLQSIDEFSSSLQNYDFQDPPLNYCSSQASLTSFQRNGWVFVKQNIPKIVEYGRKEGLIGQKVEKVDPNLKKAEAKRQLDEELKELNKDHSFIHSVIPYLPLPAAVLCCTLNFLIPGSGTFLSGVCCICMGQTRIKVKEGKVFITLIVNTIVAIAQLGTITFLLVGWFWSMAWGGLLFMHSLQYRDTVIRKRQVAVATAAIEALTNNTLRRRRKVAALVANLNNAKPPERKNSIINGILKSIGSQEHVDIGADQQLSDDQVYESSENTAQGDTTVRFSLKPDEVINGENHQNEQTV